MIYLIGVNNHNIQHDGNGCADLSLRNKFSAFLKNKIVEYDIALLAEEFSEEALYKTSKGNMTTAQSAVKDLKAENLKIEHRFCDPDEEKRKEIGIPSRDEIKSKLGLRGPILLDSIQDKQIKEELRKYYPTREQFWFNKISDCFDRNILFLCGSNHIESFSLLLNSRQYKTEILCE